MTITVKSRTYEMTITIKSRTYVFIMLTNHQYDELFSRKYSYNPRKLTNITHFLSCYLVKYKKKTTHFCHTNLKKKLFIRWLLE